MQFQIHVSHQLLSASLTYTTAVRGTNFHFVLYQCPIQGENRILALSFGDHCSVWRYVILSYSIFHKHRLYWSFWDCVTFWLFQVHLKYTFSTKKKKKKSQKTLHPLKNAMENCSPHLLVLAFETKIMNVYLNLGVYITLILMEQDRHSHLRIYKEVRQASFWNCFYGKWWPSYFESVYIPVFQNLWEIGVTWK